MGKRWKEPLKVKVVEGRPIPAEKLLALKALIRKVALRILKEAEEAAAMKEAAYTRSGRTNHQEQHNMLITKRKGGEKISAFFNREAYTSPNQIKLFEK
jgi:hypothetical protein